MQVDHYSRRQIHIPSQPGISKIVDGDKNKFQDYLHSFHFQTFLTKQVSLFIKVLKYLLLKAAEDQNLSYQKGGC